MKPSYAIKSALPVAVLGFLALGLTPTPAAAATATATFAVSATVQATCVTSATAMAFGTYIPTAASTSTSTISVTCTSGTSYQVGLSAGIATGATVTARQMTAGSATLAYILTQDGAHATNWGNTPGTDTPTAVIGNGSAQAVTVYGQIAAGQYVATGAYTDSIVATVTY